MGEMGVSQPLLTADGGGVDGAEVRRGRSTRLGSEIDDHSDDVVGNQPADRPARIDRVQDGAVRSEEKSGRLQVARLLVGIGAGESRNLAGIGAMPYGKAQPVFLDRFARRGLVVDRERDDRDAGLGHLLGCSLEAGELSDAIGAPGTAIEEDYAEGAGEPIGKTKRPAAGRRDLERRKGFAILQTDRGGFHGVDHIVHTVFRF